MGMSSDNMQNCHRAMKKMDFDEFEFNILQYQEKSTPLLKAFQLFIYLSKNDIKTFFLFLESFSIEETEDLSIKFVLLVYRYYSTDRLFKLKEVSKNNKFKEFEPFLKKLIKDLEVLYKNVESVEIKRMIKYQVKKK